jgi:hypothetical protein
METSGPPPPPRGRRPVDEVALVLSGSLGLISVLILVATTIQILDHSTPDITLSENATQILIAAIGGLTGLLGAYIGLNRGGKNGDEE